jgi:chemotaxis protein methyltransferase CheR
VHHQVCKRIARRLQELHLPNPAAYRTYLESHPDEWGVLDSFCRISISRFGRDRTVFDRLAAEVLPHLASEAEARGDTELSCWSIGCASGEEPYSLNMLWKLELAERFPALRLHVVATEIDEQLLDRALTGQYRKSSLKELPSHWIDVAFTRSGEWYVIRAAFRKPVEFHVQDIRTRTPDGPFDLVLCRNLAFTYFDPSAQLKTLERVLATLRAGGALVIGFKETLTDGAGGVEEWVGEAGVYRKC